MTGALTLAWVEGTYLGTTMTLSRHRLIEFGHAADDSPTTPDGPL